MLFITVLIKFRNGWIFSSTAVIQQPNCWLQVCKYTARPRVTCDVIQYIKIKLIPWRSPPESCFGRAWIPDQAGFKKISAPICTGYYSLRCMRHLPDITTLLWALETRGQESLSPGCMGVAAVTNVCVVLFILAHICGVTQHVLVVKGNVVNSFKPFKSDHLRSSSYTPFFSLPSLLEHREFDTLSLI